MKGFAVSLVAVALLMGASDRALAKCGDNPGDAAAVAATRAQVDAQCPCGSAMKHGDYVRCARSVANIAIYALPGDGGGLLAVHARAPRRGSYVVDEAHWDGLPDGHTRAVTAGGPPPPPGRPGSDPAGPAGPLGALLAAHPAAAAPVARRPPSDYEQAALPGMPPRSGPGQAPAP